MVSHRTDLVSSDGSFQHTAGKTKCSLPASQSHRTDLVSSNEVGP